MGPYKRYLTWTGCLVLGYLICPQHCVLPVQRSAELCGRKASQTKSKKDKKGALEGLGLEPGLVCPTVLLLMIYDQVAISRKL